MTETRQLIDLIDPTVRLKPEPADIREGVLYYAMPSRKTARVGPETFACYESSRLVLVTPQFAAHSIESFKQILVGILANVVRDLLADRDVEFRKDRPLSEQPEEIQEIISRQRDVITNAYAPVPPPDGPIWFGYGSGFATRPVKVTADSAALSTWAIADLIAQDGSVERILRTTHDGHPVVASEVACENGVWEGHLLPEAWFLTALTSYLHHFPDDLSPLSHAQRDRATPYVRKQIGIGPPKHPMFLLHVRPARFCQLADHMLNGRHPMNTLQPAESPSTTVRVVVIGGDARVKRQTWPEGIEVRAFTSREAPKAVATLQSGVAKIAVILTRWIGHTQFDTIKQAAERTILWQRGIPQLAAEIRTLIGLDPPAAATPAAASPAPAERSTPRPDDDDVLTWGASLSALEGAWTVRDALLALEVEPESPEAESVRRAIRALTDRGQLVSDGRAYQLAVKPKPEPEPVPEPAPTPTPTPAPAATPPIASTIDASQRYIPLKRAGGQWSGTETETIVRFAEASDGNADRFVEDVWRATGTYRTPATLNQRLRSIATIAKIPTALLRNLDIARRTLSKIKRQSEIEEARAIKAGRWPEYISADAAVRVVGNRNRLNELPYYYDRITGMSVYETAAVKAIHDQLASRGIDPAASKRLDSGYTEQEWTARILAQLEAGAASMSTLTKSTRRGKQVLKALAAQGTITGHVVHGTVYYTLPGRPPPAIATSPRPPKAPKAKPAKPEAPKIEESIAAAPPTPATPPASDPAVTEVYRALRAGEISAREAADLIRALKGE